MDQTHLKLQDEKIGNKINFEYSGSSIKLRYTNVQGIDDLCAKKIHLNCPFLSDNSASDERRI